MALPTVFLSWEWITGWIKHFGKHYNILVLFVFDQSELRAILPLAQRAIRLEDGFLRVNTITLCGSIELYPDHLDIICNREDNANIYIKQLFYFLTHEYQEWDILQFAFLAGKGDLSSWFQCANNGHKVKLSNKTISPCLSMETDFDSFFKKNMKRKKRYNLNRERKILIEEHNVKLRKIERLEELKKGLEDLFRLHRVRAQQKGITSTFEGDKIYNFHREISKIFLELGWLRFYLLESHHNAISAAYGFVFDRRFNLYQTGLDPEWRDYSPGKIMIFTILEDMFNEDIVEFDFLGGSDNYKTFWTKNYREMVTINIFNRNICASVEYWASNLRDRIKSLLIRTYCYDSLRRLFVKKNV